MPPQASSKRRSPLATAAILASAATAVFGLSWFIYTQLSSTDVDKVSQKARKRRRVLLVAEDPEEVLRVLSAESAQHDELTVLLYCQRLGPGQTEEQPREVPDDIMRQLQRRAAHVLRYETSTGVIHISRHLSPDLIVMLPSSEMQHAADIKDWVGQIVLCAAPSASAIVARNVAYVSPSEDGLLERAFAK